MMKSVEFTAVDTLFFKEARPMDGFGGSELKSVFPPPVRTLAGALRTSYGDYKNIDWREFKKDEAYKDIKAVIGDANGYGKLSFGGVFVSKNLKRLYPAPKHLTYFNKNSGNKSCQYGAMVITDDFVECDMGRVRLPSMPKDVDGKRFTSLPDDSYIDEEGLMAVLSGGLPHLAYQKEELFCEESRVGIGMESKSRIVKEGALYHTKHIRPKDGVSITLDVDGLPNDFPTKGFCRLGGEGRAAEYKIKDDYAIPKVGDVLPDKEILGVILILLTNGDISPHLFEGFGGELNGVKLKVASACIGKAFIEGGFNQAKNASRAAKSYIRAGSVWFCEIENGNVGEAIQKLNGMRIGGEMELGYGLIACGYWTKNKGDA